MDIESIKSFWSNWFDEGCDKDKLITCAKDDINSLIETIEQQQEEIERLKVDLIKYQTMWKG